MDLPPQVRESIEAACSVRENAHAPYSDYRVGAALRTVDRRLFSGCNVENRSYGLTVCAERIALFAAVAAGATEFEHLALALPRVQPPCGACLQVLVEFCEQLPIWVVDPQHPGQPTLLRLEELLPIRFDPGWGSSPS